MLRLMASLLFVCATAADGIGRVLGGPLRGMRSAEMTMTNARPAGRDRLQGRLQQQTVSGMHLEWSQLTGIMGREITLGLKADGTEERVGLTQVKLGSGILDAGVFDLSGECTYDCETDKAAVDLVLTSAGGTMFSVAADAVEGIEEVSAFHRAGPVNLQPRWLPRAGALRLHVGRGGAFRRCPVSLQADLSKRTGATNVEIKARRQLGADRMLRAVWLATQGDVVLELTDMATEQGATWVARARAPCRLGSAGRLDLGQPELTLRRKWRW